MIANILLFLDRNVSTLLYIIKVLISYLKYIIKVLITYLKYIIKYNEFDVLSFSPGLFLKAIFI